jgi:hypothetical protein
MVWLSRDDDKSLQVPPSLSGSTNTDETLPPETSHDHADHPRRPESEPADISSHAGTDRPPSSRQAGSELVEPTPIPTTPPTIRSDPSHYVARVVDRESLARRAKKYSTFALGGKWYLTHYTHPVSTDFDPSIWVMYVIMFSVGVVVGWQLAIRLTGHY